MTSINELLPDGETIGDSKRITAGKEPPFIDYVIHAVIKDGETSKDRVVLAVAQNCEPCILIDGNPLSIRALSGEGILHLVKLDTGEVQEIDLLPDTDQTTVNPGYTYWYECTSRPVSDPLTIYDHCPGFDEKNEPSVADIVSVLSGLALR